MGRGRGEEMEGCGKFMKASLIISNFLILIGGLIVFGLGMWTLMERSYFADILGTNLYLGITYTLIATGGAVVLLSLVGCLGASKEVRCMLLTYFIIMFVIFVTMLLGGILGFVYREKVKTSLKHEMISSLKFYGNSQENGKAITKSWDMTQENLFCCGVTGPEDWGNHIPISCCIETAPNKRQPCGDLFTTGTRHNEGCLNVTMELIEQQTLIISIAAVCAAFFMLLGMIFSCSLFKLIK